jgi:putative ABC transport system substrate-binding protein
MKRREFIGVLGGAAVWPLVARAQQPEVIRRIGVLIPFSENGPETVGRLPAFRQRLQDLGWIDGRSVQFDARYSETVERTRSAAVTRPAHR